METKKKKNSVKGATGLNVVTNLDSYWDKNDVDNCTDIEEEVASK